MPERCRIVDARYLAPDIPAETPPTFGVAEGARVIPVNDLVRLEEAPSQYVVVGLGQDRDRRLHLAAARVAWTPTRSAGCGRATRGC